MATQKKTGEKSVKGIGSVVKATAKPAVAKKKLVAKLPVLLSPALPAGKAVKSPVKSVSVAAKPLSSGGVLNPADAWPFPVRLRSK